jgi:hypothetical protein
LVAFCLDVKYAIQGTYNLMKFPHDVENVWNRESEEGRAWAKFNTEEFFVSYSSESEEAKKGIMVWHKARIMGLDNHK